MKPSTDLLSEIARLRKAVQERRAQLDRIQSAHFPAAYCKSEMRRHIQDLAKRGKPNVMPLLSLDSDVEFVHERLQVAVHNTQTPAIGFASLPDALGLFAWMHKDALIKALEREIDASAGEGTMGHTERAEAEAKVLSEILALEREEAAHVHLAQEAGLPIEHRSDCSPLAILQIRLVTPPAGPAGTSPEHAYNVIGA